MEVAINDMLIKFFSNSLLLEGQMNIDNITIDTIIKICKEKIENLQILRTSLVNALSFRYSINGEKVLEELEYKIKELKERLWT